VSSRISFAGRFLPSDEVKTSRRDCFTLVVFCLVTRLKRHGKIVGYLSFFLVTRSKRHEKILYCSQKSYKKKRVFVVLAIPLLSFPFILYLVTGNNVTK